MNICVAIILVFFSITPPFTICSTAIMRAILDCNAPKSLGTRLPLARSSSPVPRSLSAFLTSCTLGFTSWAMNRKSKSQVVSRDSYKTSPPPHKKWTLPVQVAHPSPRKVRNALPPRRPFVSYSLLPGYSTWSNDLGMPGDDA